MKILHIAKNSKFILPFIEFIKDNFDINEHTFLMIGKSMENVDDLPDYESIKYFSAPMIGKYFKFSKEIKSYFHKSEKVILHGLNIPNLIFFLFFNRKFSKKCYWIIWGGDLYYYRYNSKRLWSNFYEIFRRGIIRNLGHVITYAKGDYDIAKRKYKTKAEFHECLFYPYL